MKVSAFLVVASAASASAFVPATKAPTSTQLHIATSGKVGPVRKAIATLTKDNFSATLDEIEPFLTQEAGRTIYTKSMRRISVKAKSLGVEVPKDFAREAKCTQKRREKHDAYCQTKAEEAAAAAMAAEVEAAQAAAEAAETVKEETLVEA